MKNNSHNSLKTNKKRWYSRFYNFSENEVGDLSTANIGTTAEIFSYKDETDDETGLSSSSLMAKGRQRFKIIESRRSNTG